MASNGAREFKIGRWYKRITEPMAFQCVKRGDGHNLHSQIPSEWQEIVVRPVKTRMRTLKEALAWMHEFSSRLSQGYLELIPQDDADQWAVRLECNPANDNMFYGRTPFQAICRARRALEKR